MKRIFPVIACCLVFFLASLSTCTAPSVFEKPNIIVIFTDDQGYADLGIQGVDDQVKTPNIDRLATEGVRMISGYVSTPICSPSWVDDR
jgi:arylsulfatase A-like enzyme